MKTNSNNFILPVIMAGGTGSRLWPLSREQHPKQFLKLHGDTTMLQETVSRLATLDTLDPVIICNDDHRFLVAEQLREIGKLANNIILEPEARNTAPAIALAAFTALKKKPDNDPLLLVLAADHVIQHETSFVRAVNSAVTLAEAGNLVTFGIVPTHAETGYGYIRRGKKVSEIAYKVAQFAEKPDAKNAQHYLESGNYYWNSGMFLFRATQFLAELKKYRPDIYTACEHSASRLTEDLDFVRINKDDFIQCPAESIDYAVMEHTQHAVVVPMEAGWSDVGSWSSLWEISEKDAGGNVLKGDVIQRDCLNTYVHSENILVAAIGLKNTVIVQTPDALLIADKNCVQNVKNVVEVLKSHERKEYKKHKITYRPWGSIDTLARGKDYIVNRLTIHPKKKISTQIHQHRTEHWIVVSGTALVKQEEKEFLIHENESMFIPVGTAHALSNPGVLPLEIIEIQSGNLLSEDDILRVSEFNSGK